MGRILKAHQAYRLHESEGAHDQGAHGILQDGVEQLSGTSFIDAELTDCTFDADCKFNGTSPKALTSGVNLWTAPTPTSRDVPPRICTAPCLNCPLIAALVETHRRANNVDLNGHFRDLFHPEGLTAMTGVRKGTERSEKERGKYGLPFSLLKCSIGKP